ncbi:MAG TPA: M61 family peptidase, partial [Gammaproteobacteria bacterium]|nr:M61 family peptidase [Gammaproteobacteria bacterium]
MNTRAFRLGGVLAACLATVWAGTCLAGTAPALDPGAYPGTLTLAVDVSDASRKLFRVHETIPVKPGPLTLYYPQWIPGEHSPSGPIENMAGLTFRADGKNLPWRRDLTDMFAFHLTVPEGTHTLEVSFDFLSPDNGGEFGTSVSVTPAIVDLEWNQVVLYPAGYWSRDITVQPAITLPADWQFGTALLTAARHGDSVTFKPVTLNNLVDSPLIAGAHFTQVDLAPGARVPVYMDIVADAADDLAITAKDTEHYRALVQQAYKLFGSHHYDQYHFLYTLSDSTGHFGLEHHQSSDDRIGADFFTKPEAKLLAAGLLPHEYVHSWNGKFRRPADLWTPNFNVPMKDDLLWVYEGLTQYFGPVLTARSGLWTPQQFRDALAETAASMDHRPGRTWRPLQDTADEAQILYYAPRSWGNWRRGTDFYPEGTLLWLDVDTKIRELSHDRRSLNDFARVFYGIHDGSYVTVTYSFDDIVKALNQVQPYDWAGFLRGLLDTRQYHAPLAGISRGGYKLVYTDTPSEITKAATKVRHTLNLMYSIGMTVHTKDGSIGDVLWNGPAFKAGIGPGMTVVAVNGREFSEDAMNQAISGAEHSSAPIELLLKNTSYYKTYKVDYHGGLKYPHLVRVKSVPDYLDR